MREEPFRGAKTWSVLAPAKVNLFFEVSDRRADGYHDIETLAAPISLYDKLEFTLLDEGSDELEIEVVDISGKTLTDVPNDRTNLVFRAHEAFRASLRETGRDASLPSFHIKIFKKIPIKSGFGGGSSDAATALSVFNGFVKAPVSEKELRAVAARVGSDVPLFLLDGASLGRGRGEIVEPFDLPELHLVAIKPRAGVATPDAYRRFDETPRRNKRSLADFVVILKSALASYSEEEFPRVVAEASFNRLEEPVATLWEDATFWSSFLRAAPDSLNARMTGSGAAFYSIFPNEELAKNAADAIRERCVRDDLERAVEGVYYAKTLRTRNGMFAEMKTSDAL